MAFEWRHPKYWAEMRKRRKEWKDHTCEKCKKQVSEYDYNREHGKKCKDKIDNA
tara:strand:- start:10220 stop:10381 length:162 start_codon:yes stop_codon:yes gene_type:complete